MNILIIEDEKLASDKLEKAILEIEPTARIVGTFQTVSASVDFLQNNTHPDLIFTDVRLLDGLCFDIFEQVQIHKPVIFTTAYDHFAIRAFQVNSIDYLLKPVVKERLKLSIEKFKNLQAESPMPLDYKEVVKLLKGPAQEYKSRFMVRLGQKILALSADKIAYFFSENKLTFIVSKDGKRYPIDQPLEDLVDLLDPKIFFRINRQYIVTFESIAEIHPYFKGRIKLDLNPKSDEEVIISSERTPEFKKWIDK